MDMGNQVEDDSVMVGLSMVLIEIHFVHQSELL